MSDHELLVRHAARWASEKKRTFDPDLIETALDLRATHDGEAANRWERGSVRHLMLVRWPSHGPAGVPDVDLLVRSLDTFWRFLRGTGRMAGASAEPATLLAEAKASAKKMPAACDDPANFGSAKGLLQFGRDIGIDLDGADTMEELNARMQQVVDAWNAQPDEVRMARPGAGHAGSRMGGALSSAATHMLGGGSLPPDWHLPELPRLDGDEGDDEPMYPNPTSVSAPFARSSDYVRRALTLADWADGEEVTGIGVLRPAAGRRAYDDLDLWPWDLAYLQALDTYPTPLDQAVEAELKRSAREAWRSSADCLALDRLWTPAVAVGLIDVSGRRARRLHDHDPETDDDWVGLAHVLGLALVRCTVPADRVGTLLLILFSLAEPWGGGPLTLAELQDLYWQQEFGTSARLRDDPVWRDIADETIAHRVAAFDDLGWWRHESGRLHLTPLGWDFALMLVSALDNGLLYPESDDW